MSVLYEQNLSSELGASNGADIYRQLVIDTPGLIVNARVAATEQAYSYRNFLVGASAAVSTADGSETISTGNLKKRPDTDKVCAEKRLFGIAEKIGALSLAGIVVVGTTNRREIADVSERPTSTLCLCSDCRNVLFATSRFVTNNFLVVTAGLDRDIIEAQTYGALQNAYLQDKYTIPSAANFSLTPEANQARLDRYDELISNKTANHSPKYRAVAAQMALTAGF